MVAALLIGFLPFHLNIAIDCVVAILDSADLDVVTVLVVAIVIVVTVEPVFFLE